MEAVDFLEELSNSSGISGNEHNLLDLIKENFSSYVDEIKIDNLGNLIGVKKSKLTLDNNIKKRPKIMIAAHMDEVGFMVKSIEDNGFIKFTSIGGIDPRTVVGQEVELLGNKKLFGVINSKPPHIQESSEVNKSIDVKEMLIDLGFKKEELEKFIRVGDPITIKREFTRLMNSRVCGKALDNRAGIVAMYECAKLMSEINHEADIYYVCTVQEETTMSGAHVAAYEINPDFAIAVDVGFGRTPELKESESLELDMGPGVTLGGNIHSTLRKKLVEIAEEYKLPYQTEVDPGPTGTDGNAIQITRAGIPTLVLSIPLRYMHTSVELLSMKDILNTSKILAFFIKSIKANELEELLCY